MNTFELAHEFYEAQLHSNNGIPNQHTPTEERDTDACTDAILLDEKMRFSCTCENKNC